MICDFIAKGFSPNQTVLELVYCLITPIGCEFLGNLLDPRV